MTFVERSFFQNSWTLTFWNFSGQNSFRNRRCHQNSLKIRIGIPSGKAAGFAYRWYQISKWLFSFIVNCLRILRVFLSIPTPDRRNQMALEWFLDSGIPTSILEECRYYVSASHSTSFDLRYGLILSEKQMAIEFLKIFWRFMNECQSHLIFR